MKSTSLKTLHLSKEELRTAIRYLISTEVKEYIKYQVLGYIVLLRESECSMDWNDKGELVVSFDEEVEDR